MRNNTCLFSDNLAELLSTEEAVFTRPEPNVFCFNTASDTEGHLFARI